MKKWAQASLVTATKPAWIFSDSETKASKNPTTFLQFSASIPQTRRKEELRDRRRGTFPKELPRTEPKTHLSASSCCQLMVSNVRPCRCYPEICSPLPGAGLDRFLVPSVSLTTRYRWSVFAS